MTKEELEKEAEQYAVENWEHYEEGQTDYKALKQSYIAGAEPREKRIEELIALINAERERQEKCDDVHLRKIAELEKENAELRKVAEFQQSSNMSRHFENKKLKEGLAVGSTFNKALNSMNKNLEEERDKYRSMVFDKDEHLTKATEIIKKLYAVYYDPCVTESDLKYRDELIAEIKQFLSEVEK